MNNQKFTLTKIIDSYIDDEEKNHVRNNNYWHGSDMGLCPRKRFYQRQGVLIIFKQNKNMDVIEKDVLGVTVKLSFDEVRALKQPASRVKAYELEALRRAVNILGDQIDIIDSKLEEEKAENLVLLKNIREDLEML